MYSKVVYGKNFMYVPVAYPVQLWDLELSAGGGVCVLSFLGLLPLRVSILAAPAVTPPATI